jgi:hypothetical protein
MIQRRKALALAFASAYDFPYSNADRRRVGIRALTLPGGRLSGPFSVARSEPVYEPKPRHRFTLALPAREGTRDQQRSRQEIHCENEEHSVISVVVAETLLHVLPVASRRVPTSFRDRQSAKLVSHCHGLRYQVNHFLTIFKVLPLVQA